jgi:DNA-binding response OmpR family regulator
MKKRILIVDNDEAILFAYRKLFISEGTKVDEGPDFDAVETREEAEKLLQKNKYQAAILDFGLFRASDEDGFELIRYAKEYDPCLTVIIISNCLTAETKDKACKLGADYFFEKPVSVNAIKKIVFSGNTSFL